MGGIQTYEGIQHTGRFLSIQGCPNIQGASKHVGVSKHMGASKHLGVSKHTGGIQTFGVPRNMVGGVQLYRGINYLGGVQT